MLVKTFSVNSQPSSKCHLWLKNFLWVYCLSFFNKKNERWTFNFTYIKWRVVVQQVLNSLHLTSVIEVIKFSDLIMVSASRAITAKFSKYIKLASAIGYYSSPIKWIIWIKRGNCWFFSCSLSTALKSGRHFTPYELSC